MFTIGEFATIGRVSVRMLRHYDTLGLLTPARVDPHSGYRSYGADQLRRLNRLLALKDLGFTLDQVGQLLEDDVSPDELRGMMRLRQTELVEQIAADRARLARVEARLRIIEGEGSMSTTDVTITATPGVRLASLRGHAPSAGLEDVGPVVSGLFERAGALAAGSGHGEAMASYQTLEDGSLDCRAGFVLPDATHAPDGLEVVELPALESAAVLQHHGCMEDIGGSYQRLAVWIEENGYRTDGSARERYLVSYPEPEDDWVTAIEMPVSTS
jgi:DNA-binding transcriptional MerR regulator/effector-binding domain-containing protein